ncbi:ABC-2 family transporter protein [Nonomuraea sp. NPDC048881]|uniref:ABC transporter permease n=1 Tax=unclassified Nonomuraea TaxID=2593643 RepID=UPI00340A3DF5
MKTWTLAGAWARSHSQHRLDIWARSLLPLLQIYVLIEIWSGAVDDSRIFTYLCVVNMLMWLNQSTIPWYITDRIREGTITTELMRPVGFPAQVLSHQMGSTAARATALIGMIPLTVLLAGLRAPASPTAGVLFAAGALLSYAVSVGMYGLLGVAGFWLHQTSGVVWTFSLVNALLAGTFIPLPLFPAGLREVVELLPFGAVGYTPAAVYAGMLDGWPAVRAIGVQAIWCAVLAAAIAVVWRRAQHRVVSQGG